MNTCKAFMNYSEERFEAYMRKSSYCEIIVFTLQERFQCSKAVRGFLLVLLTQCIINVTTNPSAEVSPDIYGTVYLASIERSSGL